MYPVVEQNKAIKKKDKNVKYWAGDVTERLINRLSPELRPDQITERSILIEAPKDYGKTTFMCSLAESIARRILAYTTEYDIDSDTPIHPELTFVPKLEIYQGKNFDLLPFRSIEQILDYYIMHKERGLTIQPYQLILLPDASKYNKELDKQLIARFEEIRHLVEEIVPKVCLIYIIDVQYIYKLKIDIRNAMSALAIKALQMSNQQQRMLAETVGYDIREKINNSLAGIAEKKLDENNYRVLDTTAVITHTWCGTVSLAQSPSKSWRPYKPFTNEEGIRFVEPEPLKIDQAEQQVEEDHPEAITEGHILFTPLTHKTLSYEAKEIVSYALNPQNLNTILKAQNITLNSVSKEKIEGVKLYLIDDYSADKAAHAFGYKSGSSITNKLKAGGWEAQVRAEYLGHAIEYAITRVGPYRHFNIIAGNEHIDLRLGKVGVEVKVRERRATPSFSMLSNHTKELLEKGSCKCPRCDGIEILELIQVIVYKSRKETVYTYEIYRISTDNQLGADGDSGKPLQPPHPSWSSKPSKPVKTSSSASARGATAKSEGGIVK